VYRRCTSPASSGRASRRSRRWCTAWGAGQRLPLRPNEGPGLQHAAPALRGDTLLPSTFPQPGQVDANPDLQVHTQLAPGTPQVYSAGLAQGLNFLQVKKQDHRRVHHPGAARSSWTYNRKHPNTYILCMCLCHCGCHCGCHCMQGLNSLQVMDKIIAACTARGIKVILDYHRMHLTDSNEYGLWYDAASPESTWIGNWAMLAKRYKGNPTIVGVSTI